MKHFVVIVVLNFAVHSFCSALTLNEALEHTYQNNPQLKAVRETVKAVDESIMQALSGFLPKVSLGRQYISRKDIHGSIDSLSVSQNLFSGGRDVSAMKQAKYSIKRSHAGLIDAEQQVLVNTVDIYLKTLQMFEVYQISKQREAEAKKYLVGIKSRFAAGQNTKTDVAQAEASATSFSALRARSYSDYESLKAAFVKITGLEPKKLSLPKDNIKLPKTLEFAISEAITRNPSLIYARAEYMTAQEGVAGSASSLLPSVDLRYLNQDVSKELSGIINSPSGSQITLDISVPIFTGGTNWSKVRQSTREAKNKKYGLEDVKNGVVQNATSAWESLNAARSILEARKQEVKSSKIAYEGFVAEEKAGLKDTIDVITIRARYFDASVEMLSSRTDYYNKIYQLKSHIGECTPKGLGLKVKPYDPMENYKGIRWQWFSAFTGD